MRNPMLTYHAVRLLLYRGLGRGIPRVLHRCPQTQLINDVPGNQFKAILPRPLTSAKAA
ncbi:hypothetical protein [Leptolyngbya sp. PCC 6406]|uniref:hypothetical protein n=1 Tax=Leptolyngbya sp. PCC 6406 TaxID=1173264 RepID=UPI0002AD10EF|nr:hypothetical protein [Leptolyngbya sp. PCC 6406]